MTTIDLIRHGDASPGVCLGSNYDPPLTEKGWSQMRGVLAWVQPPWDGVVSSPLLRCASFAEELAEHYSLSLRVESRFRELGFGEWEGRSWSDLYRQEGGKLLEFQRCPSYNPAPGGEDYQEFEARVAAAWYELLIQSHGNHSLVVTHAGVIRTILRLVLGFPEQRLFSLHVPHAGLTRIQQKGDVMQARLVFHGGRL